MGGGELLAEDPAPFHIPLRRTMTARRSRGRCDRYSNVAPSPSIAGRKVGKLVAIIAVSSTVIGSRLASPMTRKLMAMRWSMWVATRPPPLGRAALDEEIVALDRMRDAGGGEAGGDRGEAVALLDPELVQAAHPRRPRGEGRGDGEDRIFVDHRGRARGGHVDALQRARPDAQVGDLLAAFDAPVEQGDVGAHLEQRRQKPGAQRVGHHALDHDVGAGHDQRRDDRERRRGRIGRHDDRSGPQLRAGRRGRCDAPRPPA